jgi:hypothetical protein
MKQYSKKNILYLHLKAKIIQVLRHIPITKWWAKGLSYGKQRILTVENGRRKLIQMIQSGQPFMAARFGTSEGCFLYNYLYKQIIGGRYSQKAMNDICNCSGFFPQMIDKLEEWANKELEACPLLDILGVMNFVGEEWIVRQFCPKAILMPSGGLSSTANGWAYSLEGMKVLVIHPFSETIISQYNNHREAIFPGTNALPKFDLQCIKAVQTIADQTDERFSNWFEALDYMSEEVSKKRF